MEPGKAGGTARDLNRDVTIPQFSLAAPREQELQRAKPACREVGQVGVWEEALVISELLISQELFLPLFFPLCVCN